MRIAIIAAIGRNRVIGRDGRSWHIPEDLARFKRLTSGHALLMGRRTYEAIGRPLPGAGMWFCIPHPIPGVETFTSIKAALAALRTDEPSFCHGGVIPVQVFPSRADLLYLTRVDQSPEGDTFFPP